ncbi:MAG: efflux RND transporter periplasmic adaptor subunit [Eggerthellaceae bacterium]|nr:efflux RND transporter periplasmic adaptor subunit [Eggerthellaceae bacterium]
MGNNDIPTASPLSDSTTPQNAAWGSTTTPSDGAISDAEALNALKVLEERRKERRKQKIIKIVIGAAVLAAVGAGVFFFTQNKPTEAEDVGPIVETDVVVREDFSIPISGNGSLQAQSSVTVNPEIEGTVTEVFAQEGDQVEKGTTLFTIESEEVEKDIEEAADKISEAEEAVSEAQAAVGSAQSALNSANSAYKSAKSRADKAKKKYQNAKKKQDAAIEKAEKAGKKAGEKAGKTAGEAAKKDKYDEVYEQVLDETGDKDKAKKQATKEAQAAYDKAYDDAYWPAYNAAYEKVKIPKVPDYDKEAYQEEVSEAKAEVDAASAEVSAAQGDVRAAQSELSSAQADYEKAEAQREKCTVVAPQAGTLVSFKLEVGDDVGSSDGDSDSSVRISDLSHLRMSIEVNESDIAKVEVGQAATVVPQAFSDLTLQAQVSEIAESATGMEDGGYDGGSVTFSVRLTIDEPDERLKPGMTASVKILTEEVKDALIVPVNALIEEEDGTYVDVVIDEETYETERKKVKVQVKDNTRAVIKKGLKEGDIVVVSSIDFTEDEEEGYDDYDSDMEEDDYEDEVELDDADEFEA